MLSIDGLREKDLVNMHLLRRATFIIAASGMNGKHIARNLNRLWPVTVEDEDGGMERAKELLKTFKQRDLLKQAKDGRRLTDTN